jgi:hypothetical protein
MSNLDRRQFLKSILGKLVQTAGTVVVASAAASLAKAQGNESEAATTPPEDVRERADRLAATGNVPDEADPAQLFRPGGFRNTPLGSFINRPLGSFRNTPIGAFRNTPVDAFRNTPVDAFRNTPGGVFANGGWPNGGWPNGGWGGFHNGGWPNFGWRNW